MDTYRHIYIHAKYRERASEEDKKRKTKRNETKRNKTKQHRTKKIARHMDIPGSSFNETSGLGARVAVVDERTELREEDLSCVGGVCLINGGRDTTPPGTEEEE